MKIKSVAALCRASKSIILCKGKNDWVGNMTAIYPLYNMPRMEMKNVCSMFDIPEEKQSAFHLDVKDTFPAAFSEEDDVKQERPITRLTTVCINTGENYEVIETSAGMRLLNTKYLSPFVGMEGIQLYERISGNGLYIAVKSGFILYGLIIPAAPDPESCKTIFSEIKTIYSLIRRIEVEEGINDEED